MRKAIVQPSTTAAKEEIKLRFIDTSSKYGHGRFQTKEEKKAWYGKTKKDKLIEAKRKQKERAERARLGKQKGKDVEDDEDEDDPDKYLSKSAKKRKGSKKKGSGKKGKGSKKKTQRK